MNKSVALITDVGDARRGISVNTAEIVTKPVRDMPNTIEFFFDFVSPNAYIAYQVLPKIADKAGAELIYRPMFLGGVMKATGNSPPDTVPAKGAWMLPDLDRWCAKYGITFNFNPYFPMNTLPILRGACALQNDPKFSTYVDAMFNAIWFDPKNMAEPEEIAKVVSELGIDPEAFAATVQMREWKQAAKANTDEAVERGVFGAPSIFVGDDLYFGQDRLFMVAEAVGIHITDVVPGY